MHAFDVFDRASRRLRKDIRDLNFVVESRTIVVIVCSGVVKIVAVVVIASGLKLVFKRDVVPRV